MRVSPSRPSWAIAIARGLELAKARKEDGLPHTYSHLYQDFFNSCQHVPLKWLKQFTFEVEKELRKS